MLRRDTKLTVPSSRQGSRHQVVLAAAIMAISAVASSACDARRAASPAPGQPPLVRLQVRQGLPPVVAVALTPNGRLAVSASGRALKLWDVTTQTALRGMTRHVAPISSLSLSGDGTQTVSGDESGRIVLWDLRVDDRTRDIAELGARVRALAFVLPDTVLAVDGAGRPSLWHGRAMRRSHDWDGILPTNITAVATGIERKRAGSACLLLGLESGAVAAYRVRNESRSGRQRGALRAALERPRELQLGGAIERLSIAGDCTQGVAEDSGGRLVTWRLGGSRYDVLSDDTVHTALAISQDGSRAVSATDSGAMSWWDLRQHSLRAAATEDSSVHAVALSRNGDWALVGSEGASEFPRSPLTRWRLDASGDLQKQDSYATLPRISTVDIASSRQANGAVNLRVITVSEHGRLHLWDMARLAARPLLEQETVLTAALAPSGDSLVLVNNAGLLKIYDLSSPEPRPVNQRHSGCTDAAGIHRVQLTDGAREALVGCGNDTVLVPFDEARPLLRLGIGGSDCAVSADATSVLVAAASGTALEQSPRFRLLFGHARRLWGGTTAPAIHLLVAHPLGPRPLARAAWQSPRVPNRRAQTARTASGWVPLLGHPTEVTAVAVAQNGGFAASTGSDGSIRVWDLHAHRLVEALESTGYRGEAVAISADGHLVASGQDDGVVRLWNVVDHDSWEVSDHSARITSVAVSPDGEYVVSGSMDGSARVTHVRSRESVALSTAGREWIAYTDEGYFDGSLGASELVSVTHRERQYDVDQIAVYANRPDKILDRLGLSGSESRGLFAQAHAYRLRQFGLQDPEEAGAGHRTTAAHVDPMARVLASVPEAKILKVVPTDCDANEAAARSCYCVTFSLAGPEKAPPVRYNVFVNNVPIAGAEGMKIGVSPTTLSGCTTRSMGRESARATSMTVGVELCPGRNRIEVGARNADGLESLKDSHTVEVPAPPGMRSRLFVLAVGVSQNAEVRRSNAETLISPLTSPGKDAKNIADAFTTMGGWGSYDSPRVTTLVDDEGGRVTKEEILLAGEKLKEASVNDTVVVFIAGHGTYHPDAGGTPRYFFLTSNSGPRFLPDRAVSFEDLERLLDGVAARNKLLLIDTCYSGREGAPRVDSDRNRFVFTDLSYHTGAVVFSSSRWDEVSKEDANNGRFTHALLEALRGERGSDVNGDCSLELEELERFVMARVPQMNAEQHPTIDQDNPLTRLAFPVVGCRPEAH